jgi:hypothetical protein
VEDFIVADLSRHTSVVGRLLVSQPLVPRPVDPQATRGGAGDDSLGR